MIELDNGTSSFSPSCTPPPPRPLPLGPGVNKKEALLWTTVAQAHQRGVSPTLRARRPLSTLSCLVHLSISPQPGVTSSHPERGRARNARSPSTFGSGQCSAIAVPGTHLRAAAQGREVPWHLHPGSVTFVTQLRDRLLASAYVCRRRPPPALNFFSV